MKLVQFARNNGSVFKAKLSDDQAKAVLNENGYKKYLRGGVIYPTDYADRVYLAAAQDKSGLIKGVNRHREINPRESQKTIALASMILAGLAWMGRKYNA